MKSQRVIQYLVFSSLLKTYDLINMHTCISTIYFQESSSEQITWVGLGYALLSVAKYPILAAEVIRGYFLQRARN